MATKECRNLKYRNIENTSVFAIEKGKIMKKCMRENKDSFRYTWAIEKPQNMTNKWHIAIYIFFQTTLRGIQ